MYSIVDVGRSAVRQLVLTAASVLLPAGEDRPAVELTQERAETISLGLNGISYEIDLSPADATALRARLAPWVEHAHPVSRPTPRRTTPRRTTPRRTRRSAVRAHPATTIRHWARTHGYPVSDRGRLPTTVVQAYQAAH